LYLINSPLRFKAVSRDRLYYDQYQYCMRVALDEAGSLRKLSHTYIDLDIERRRAWLIPRIVLTQTIQNLHAVCDVLLAAENPYKMQVNYRGICLYTNDTALFVKLLAIPRLTDFSQQDSSKLTQAVVDHPRNTVVLKDPQHKYRSYFRGLRVSENQKKSIGKLLAANQDTVRTSVGIKHWLASGRVWAMPHYFIDHDDESCLIMLSLIYPGLIKNTVDIVKSS
jgi:hypothetical protein